MTTNYSLTFLGSASAFTVGTGNYQTNMLLESEDKQTLLIDCGTDIRLSLHEQNRCYKEITDVYISHLHGDHAGGLEWLATNTYYGECHRKPKLYLSERIVGDLWNNALSGALSSVEAVEADLSTYFDVNSIPDCGRFQWQNISFQLVQTLHAYIGFRLMPSYGLLFELNGVTVFITTDTQFTLAYLAFYKKADLIFHDCETCSIRTNVHAHYDDLVKLPEEIKGKMWLSHYNDSCPQDPKSDGFLGFVKKGQVFEF